MHFDETAAAFPVDGLEVETARLTGQSSKRLDGLLLFRLDQLPAAFPNQVSTRENAIFAPCSFSVST